MNPKPSLKGKVILTGDRPTGSLHIGHYFGSLKQRVELQGDNKQFIIIADAQALTDNFDNPKKVADSILDVTMDYLSVGIDPTQSTIFIQSQIPQLFELTSYYMNLVSVNRLERNPTVKTEIKERKIEHIPTGFYTYPISQAADITAFKADLVPVGDDQLPMIELTREIVNKFNKTYSEVLVLPQEFISKHSRVPGIDGNHKMGKSLGNAIYLKDDEKTLKSKVMKMFTDPNHIRIEDPGTVEGNVVFTYLDMFDPNVEEVMALKEHYRRGGLGDGTLKVRLFGVLNEILEPIRKRRAEFENDPGEIMNILSKGTDVARGVAAQTLDEVKSAMQIAYFKK